MNDNMCEQSPLQAEDLGQIDIESRNAEIYRKFIEEYISGRENGIRTDLREGNRGTSSSFRKGVKE